MLHHRQLKQMVLLLTIIAATGLAQPLPERSKVAQNPFLASYNTPHQTVPFNQIKTTHYLPALTQALAAGRKEVTAIVDNPAPPTFANTVDALERSGQLIRKVNVVMRNLNMAETSPELQKIVKEAAPMLSQYNNDITLNETLFARVKTVYTSQRGLKLNPEQATLLEQTYKRFVRNGAHLDKAGKERLQLIDKALSELSLQFSENVLNETNGYSLLLTEEKELAGLPDYARQAAKAAAQQKGKAGWLFTLQWPSYLAFMQHADNRPLRRNLYLAFNSRGFHGDTNDNSALVKKMVDLRYERAKLLGYQTHADFVLEESMVGSKEKVQLFLRELVGYARPTAQRQLAELTAYARANGFASDTLQEWDYLYYAEKLKKEKYSIDDDVLRPYFKLDNALNGAFLVANRLYGLTFKERKDIPLYHPEVRTFDVFDKDGQFLAVFYGDYFPRPGKQGGGWMDAFQEQRMENGQNIRPHILNVCNFTRPVAGQPALLTFFELKVLFHEFGHALHGMLANTTYESLSGTNVPRDFVELPSQLMENWCYDPDVLKLFAKHYQTGEVIPNELIEKIRASQTFLAGIDNLEMLRLSLIDMYYHEQAPTGETIPQIETKIDSLVKLFPRVAGVAISPSFDHLFVWGYSAGYYSYKWSEVLDADAYELFTEKGGLSNQAAAERFRKHVLEKGFTEKPMELYKKFRGREPSPKAMLRRSGLVL